mmetsp:Transcript_12588/g.29794  ORF Transcript_12588/g.29794 Transcript_12588/m.29794 type:complete len:331 (-) Transcript_12588:950-1942(-)
MPFVFFFFLLDRWAVAWFMLSSSPSPSPSSVPVVSPPPSADSFASSSVSSAKLLTRSALPRLSRPPPPIRSECWCCSFWMSDMLRSRSSSVTSCVSLAMVASSSSICVLSRAFSRLSLRASGWLMVSTRLAVAVFEMFRACVAYRSVLMVSSALKSAGLTQAIMIVREFPPRESCRSRVSFESRYGGFRSGRDFFFFFVAGCCCSVVASPSIRPFSASAETTCPSTNNPLLIDIPSLARPPFACVFFSRSLPARSTRVSFDSNFREMPSSLSGCEWLLLLLSLLLVVLSSEATTTTPLILRTHIAWDRLDAAFILVDATTLRLLASSMIL